MKYFLYEDERGKFEKDGKNYSILECHNVVGNNAENFKEFENLEDAIKNFKLTVKEEWT